MSAQDVERERADPGEDAGLATDAAGILAECAVAHVVIAVLDAPMAADGRSTSLGVEQDLAGVVGDLPPLPPQAGAGVPAQGATADARNAGDERPPVGIEAVGGEDLDAAMFLTTMGVAVNRGEMIARGLDGAQAGQALEQAWLVVFHPHQQRVAGSGRDGEGFFGSAGHRR
jgi:hypothetical protein